MNQVTYQIALETGYHEAVIRQAYKDSVGRWTWSVGLTSATGHNVERYIDNPAPMQLCMDVFVWALRNYAQQVAEVFAGFDLTEYQFGGAVSFHWNTGAIKRASWVKLWKEGKTAEARAAFMNWKSPPEIIPRRRKEQALFFDGVWSNDGTITEFTRVTSRHTPDWTSGRKVDVTQYLAAAFEPTAELETLEDHTPQPDAPVPVPTLSPEGMNLEIDELVVAGGAVLIAGGAIALWKHLGSKAKVAFVVAALVTAAIAAGLLLT